MRSPFYRHIPTRRTGLGQFDETYYDTGSTDYYANGGGITYDTSGGYIASDGSTVVDYGGGSTGGWTPVLDTSGAGNGAVSSTPDAQGGTLDSYGDGSYGYTQADGTYTFYPAEGGSETQNVDGSIDYVAPNGDFTHYGADGSTTTIAADGSSGYYGADGSWTETKPDGSSCSGDASGNWCCSDGSCSPGWASGPPPGKGGAGTGPGAGAGGSFGGGGGAKGSAQQQAQQAVQAAAAARQALHPVTGQPIVNQPPAGSGFFDSIAKSLGVSTGTAELIVLGGGLAVLFMFTRKR